MWNVTTIESMFEGAANQDIMECIQSASVFNHRDYGKPFYWGECFQSIYCQLECGVL